MSYTVRHQVFVSSTYSDLKDERAEVLQAIWELDCIPTGMEAFVASNESQWDVITRVIDECDYYVLIIGGRYGSLTAEGISYTEKEYRYAKDQGIPVIAFVHGSPTEIPIGKSEIDEQLRSKLEAFRSEVISAHPVRFWSTAAELGGLVSRSLVREIRMSPRPGWIRNDGSSPIALLEQLNALTIENRQLREATVAAEDEVDDDLEHGADEIEIIGERRYHAPRKGHITENWHVLVSWDDLFKDLGPALINEASETEIQKILNRFHTFDEIVADANIYGNDIFPESTNEVLIQLRALGLIAPGEKKRGVNDTNRYWKITPKGDRHLVTLLARRRRPPPPPVVASSIGVATVPVVASPPFIAPPPPPPVTATASVPPAPAETDQNGLG